MLLTIGYKLSMCMGNEKHNTRDRNIRVDYI